VSDSPRIIPLPNGYRAKLRDLDDVSERAVRPVKEALMVIGVDRFQDAVDGASLTPDQAEAFWRLQDLLIIAVLESWSLDRPIPTTITEVQDLPKPVYRVLEKKVVPYALPLLGGDDDFTLAGAGDPDSPTGPSAA
jgi:hypothetical protein